MRGFRAWHTKLNRYLKDDEFFISADGKVRNDSFGRGNYEEAFDTSDFDSGYIVLEQDTGLKDKNGEEIAEGDILLDDTGEPLEYWRVRYIWGKFVGECNLVSEDIFELRDLEVVGNIHENAELLEEER